MENIKLKEFNKYLTNKKVAIIGLGVSNTPLIDYMYSNKANVSIFDEREKQSIPKDILNKINAYNFKLFTEKDCFKNLKNFDIIFRSPSCLPTRPELERERTRGAIVTTEIEMLMKLCPAKIIGVTGSDRKNHYNKSNL